MTQHLNFTARATLLKLSIVKMIWIGLIPVQPSSNFLLQFGTVGQPSGKGQLAAEADRLDSRTVLLLISDPVSLEPCVCGFVHNR